MDPAVAGTPASAPPAAFEDGLGERRHTVGAGNEPLEVLRLNTVLSAVSSFEFALRERSGRLATFRHESFGRVRAVERLEKLASTLVVISDSVRGTRLSDILEVAEKRSIALEFDAARCLIRQLVSAVAALHESVPDVCHGAIGPERIIITADGRLVIVEYVLGAALEQLRYSQERYWRELRIALPGTVGPLRFDGLADVTQMGTVALALLLGRRLSSDDYPERIDEVVGSASVRSVSGTLEPLPIDLREWLVRALQLDPYGSFASAMDARANLDFALGEANPAAELAALRMFLVRCSSRGTAESVAPAAVGSVGSAELAGSKADPGAGLEALKSFLNRYPSRASTDRPPAAATTAAGAASPAAAAGPSSPVEASPGPIAGSVAAPQSPQTPPIRPVVPAQSMPPAVEGQPSASSVPLVPPAPAPRVVRDTEVENVGLLPSEATAAHRAGAVIWSRRWLIVAAVALIALTTGVTLAGLRFLFPSREAAVGTLVVGTNPGGVAVFIDGVQKGPTPLTVSLTPGEHTLELVTESGRRRIPIQITAGGQVSQFLELPQTPQTFGDLQIRTDPARVGVTVDGRMVGRSPLTVSGLTPGPHTVILEGDAGTVTEQVNIEGGVTASLVVSMARPQGSNAAGWITIAAPTDVQIFENQRLLGTSRSERIMLPVGRHELEIVNEALGYRATRTVDVSAGQVAPVRLDWPQGSLAVNALPWAEVWIDGDRIGETPIGNVAVPIGAHEIVFRHPDLGERRSVVTVTLGAPTRVGVDLRAK